MGCQQSVPTDDGSSFGVTKFPSAAGSTNGKFRPTASTESLRTTRTVNSVSTVSLGAEEDVSYLLPKVDYNGHLLTEEIVKRTSSSLQCSSLVVGKGTKKFELQYAYRSQRGYNPEEPLKSNQEKYGIELNFASDGGDAMIGVFSGHGDNGQQCANFSQRVLPQQLAKFIRQKRVQRFTKKLKAEGSMKQGAWNPKMWPLLPTGEFEHCCKRAFHETNKMLHQEKEIDDKLSGASAATVCFHGGRMSVCNVGDCRVILGCRVSGGRTQYSFDGEEEKSEIEDCRSYSETVEEKRRCIGGKRIAVPLTADHTPNRQEELERIKLAGAEVKQSDQIEDTNIIYDSEEQNDDFNNKNLRVFLPEKSHPGATVTRSIGDSALEGIGISSEPEIRSVDLTANDDILIIASNGVFEFLTNQEVVDICSASCNPLQAGEAVTKAAYNKWIEHKNRCDDITVIICFLSRPYQHSSSKNIDMYTAVMVDDHEEE